MRQSHSGGDQVQGPLGNSCALISENNRGAIRSATKSTKKAKAVTVRELLQGRWFGLWGVLVLMGPGIITSNVDNDAGGITTYSLAGREFGLSICFGRSFPSRLCLIVVQEMGARMGVVSGKGLSDLIRERSGSRSRFTS